MPSDWRVPGFTSTASLRPEALFGPAEPGTGGPPPERVTRAAGCRVWDEAGREYVDYVMALGAVALGYGHPAVNRAMPVSQRDGAERSEEHTSELQSHSDLVCRLLLEKKKITTKQTVQV